MNMLRISSPSLSRDAWLNGVPVVAVILALILALCGGCGPSARPSDPDEGRQALRSVLDAWKKGAKPDAFAAENPAIHASDGDWRSGLVLQDYRADDGRLVGSDLNYSVELQLKNRRGRVTTKTAVYAVTTHPLLLVLRTDE